MILWYPSYIDQLNQHSKDAEFNELCNRTVANRSLSGETLQELCPCQYTSYSSVVLDHLTVMNWHAANTTIRDAVVKSGSYTGITFTDVLLENVSIMEAKFQDAVFVGGAWMSVEFRNANLSGVVLCDVMLPPSALVINSTINGKLVAQAEGEAIEELFGRKESESGDCNGVHYKTNKTCTPLPKNLFENYQDTFFIAASAFPGNIVSAFALYFIFWRSLWLGGEIM